MSEQVTIDEDEWYPVFTASTADPLTDHLVVEVPDGFLARWEACEAEFDACQAIMRAAYKQPELPAPTNWQMTTEIPAGTKVVMVAGLPLPPGESFTSDGGEYVISCDISAQTVSIRKAQS